MIHIKKLSKFSTILLQTTFGLILLCITYIVHLVADNNMDKANESRLNSLLLADELRQSSNNLTRMARTYVATGNLLYKQNYKEILAIKDGKRARPVDYNNYYWDLLEIDDQKIAGARTNQAIPLIELMRQAGFSEKEFGKLNKAEKISYNLTRVEYKAMNLIESKGSRQELELNKQKATELLYDHTYLHEKTLIMLSIHEFYKLINDRTAKMVYQAKIVTFCMKILFILLGLILLYMLYRLHKELKATLGGSLDKVYEHIMKIGTGEFSPILVDKGHEKSILGCININQERVRNLIRLNERLNQLYLARSQCSLAVVHAKNEAELFTSICQNIVNFGGIKMAWIGIADEMTKELKILNAFGDGLEYLDNFHISTDPTNPTSFGPSGRAFHENKPYWCQNFQQDSATLQWQEKGKIFGWGASAVLPIKYGENVVGVFTIYAEENNIFDVEVQNLLEQIVEDINYALENFQNKILQKQTEIKLIATTKKAQNYLDIVDVMIMVLDIDQTVRLINRKGCEILGYSCDEVINKKWVNTFIPKEIRESLQVVLDNSLNTSIPPSYYENQVLTKDGNIRIIAWHNQPLYEENGDFSGLLCAGEDVTEIREAQQQLIESEDFYRTIVTSIDKAILILKNNTVVDCNALALKMFEISKEKLLGVNILNSAWNFECEDLEFKDYLNNAYKSELSKLECTLIISSTRSIVIEVTLARYGDKTDKIIMLAKDITEKIEKDKFLKIHARQAQMGEMISMIAHQWRQPLAIINAITSQMQLKEIMKEENDMELLDNLIKIEQQSIHLSQTISDYRDFFHPNKPKENIYLSTLVRQALTLIEHIIQSDNITVNEMVIFPSKVFIYRNEVLHVLITLIKNSIDAFSDNNITDRKLIFAINQDEEYGKIDIYDNAGGIHIQDIEKIFAPYFTTKNDLVGTGIGLYMSKIIIEDHCNGKLEVQSNNYETIFTIKLPLNS